MIKVFLVEDEVIIREGIRYNIDWEREGFEFVGEASDGELAYPLIQKTKPDILITDIKMPFMDGLELSRLVKQEMPDVKIMILSGYDEFEYAREGIDIGITDYLLKPIAGAKLLEAVKKVGETILKEREFQKIYEQEHQENLQIARQKFFRRLVLGKEPASVLLKEGRRIGMDMSADSYNILLFQIFDKEGAKGDPQIQNVVTQAMEKIADHMPDILMVELGIEGWGFILKGTEDVGIEALQEQLITAIKELFAEHPDVGYFGGMGKAVDRLSRLDECFGAASHAFAYRYIKKRDQIITSGELSVRPGMKEEPQIGPLEVGKLDRRIVERFLKTGLKSEIGHFLDEYFQNFGERNMQSFLFRQYVMMDMYFAAVALLEELGYAAGELVERCGDIQEMVTDLSTEERSREYLQKVLEATIDLREAVSQKKYHSLLAEAKSYIEQHFVDEDISLNTVAASVNLSANHFSSIFSQEMGQTFVEYLTSVRMERARELLRTTSMRSAQIAYAVGYKDAHYFSYLFKKTQECTPREFRNGVGG